MAFLSFIGRILFISVFLLSLWQQFTKVSEDGDVAAKFDAFSKHVVAQTRYQLPQLPPFEGFEINHLSALAVALKLTGSLLFTFGSTFGAVLLNLALAGSLLYFIGMKNSMLRRQPKKKAAKAM